MKRRWTEKTALEALKGDVEVNGKIIKVGPKGLNGLMACSAYDYLKNWCAFK